MKKTLLTAFVLASITSAAAQTTTIVQRDPLIEKIVKEVSADSLQSYVHSLVSFGTRHTLSAQDDPANGIGAAKKWVLGKFNQFAQQSGGRLTATIDNTVYQPDGRRVDKPVNLGNVVATLKGTDPNDDRIFIICGHLDSRVTDIMNREGAAPGANDDGSGIAAVIEAARILSKHAFPATVLFVAMSGEEQGLLGARYMAEKAKKENWNVAAVLNNDMVGSNNSSETNIINNTQVRIFSEGLPAYETEKNAAYIRQYGLENEGKARQLARYMKEVGERYTDNLQVVLIYRNDRFGRGGDHTPFAENGFAAIRVTDMNENFNHQHQDLRTENGIVYGDLEAFMDFEYLRKNTALNVANLANLAKAPALPQQVAFNFKQLGNATQLTWAKPSAGNPKGYYVMMRETTSPVWQKKFFTTATTMTLPYTKDNYLFAVQAVSNDGNESLPAIPQLTTRQTAPAAAQPQSETPAKKKTKRNKN